MTTESPANPAELTDYQAQTITEGAAIAPSDYLNRPERAEYWRTYVSGFRAMALMTVRVHFKDPHRRDQAASAIVRGIKATTAGVAAQEAAVAAYKAAVEQPTDRSHLTFTGSWATAVISACLERGVPVQHLEGPPA